MSYGFCLRTWGNYACFTRPEMKVERVSYDIPTPSACRGILEAIYWKPAITWMVDRIHVMKPIRFTTVRRNEVGCKVPAGSVKSVMNGGTADIHIYVERQRQQRASLLLQDVEYFIEAHFEPRASDGDNHGKHAAIFKRHAQGGKCHHQPYFGCKEFPCYFELWENDVPVSPVRDDPDLGWTLYDIDFENDMASMFYRPRLRNGVVEVPHPASEEVKR